MFVRVSAYEVACYSLAAHARTCIAVMRCATHLYLYQQCFTKYHTREKRYKEIILNWTHWDLLIFFNGRYTALNLLHNLKFNFHHTF